MCGLRGFFFLGSRFLDLLRGGLGLFHQAFLFIRIGRFVALEFVDGYRNFVQHRHGFTLQGNACCSDSAEQGNQDDRRTQWPGHSQAIKHGYQRIQGVAD